MTISFSSSLGTALAAALAKDTWLAAFIAGLGGGRTLTVKRHASSDVDVWANGTTVLSVTLVGGAASNGLAITSLGGVGTISTNLAADLSTGFAVLRVTGAGGDWVQGTFGLVGSSADFKVRSNLSPTKGLGWAATFRLNAPANLPANVAPPTEVIDTAVGAAVTSLAVTSTGAGTFPYAATVFPLRGRVPANRTLTSPSDTSMRASVLSTWDDGSAAVMVVAGSVTVASIATSSLALQLAALPGGSALTAAAISAAVTSVTAAFTGLGTASITNFSTPERTWWANAQTICARYRTPVSGHATLQLVIDIQAFADGRALVEVAVENSLLDAASPSRPLNATYSSAVISVNGSAINAPVSSSGTPEGAHTAFRSWYAFTWVGGNPGLRVHQTHTELQKHPLLFKTERTADATALASYGTDTYIPWGNGRHAASGMGGTGGKPWIGPLTQWDAHFLQSGDARAANAVEKNALAILGFNVSYRDSVTGLVPTAAQLVGKTRVAPNTWPETGGDAMSFEVAHHPAVGLMAFAVRPCPIFIEIAQQIVAHTSSWSNQPDQNLIGFDYAAAGLSADASFGIYGQYYQTRGRAWGLRSLVHATFLTPDDANGSAWRAGGKQNLHHNATYLRAWMSKPAAAAVNMFWDYGPLPGTSHTTGNPIPWVLANWQTHYLLPELHKAASARLLTGEQQTALDELADWAALYPVRWVNEQPEGGWRFTPYTTVISLGAPDANATDLGRNWNEIAALTNGGIFPATPTGPVMVFDGSSRAYTAYGADGPAAEFYPSYWWAALVAAVERNVPGSSTAWATVNAGLTNLSTWKNGFSTTPRWAAAPRRVGGSPV